MSQKKRKFDHMSQNKSWLAQKVGITKWSSNVYFWQNLSAIKKSPKIVYKSPKAAKSNPKIAPKVRFLSLCFNFMWNLITWFYKSCPKDGFKEQIESLCLKVSQGTANVPRHFKSSLQVVPNQVHQIIKTVAPIY